MTNGNVQSSEFTLNRNVILSFFHKYRNLLEECNVNAVFFFFRNAQIEIPHASLVSSLSNVHFVISTFLRGF